MVAECLTCLTPGGKVWVWDVAESLFCVLGQDTVPLFTQGQGELSGKLTKFCRGGGVEMDQCKCNKLNLILTLKIQHFMLFITRVVDKSRQPAKYTSFSARFRRLLSLF